MCMDVINITNIQIGFQLTHCNKGHRNYMCEYNQSIYGCNQASNFIVYVSGMKFAYNKQCTYPTHTPRTHIATPTHTVIVEICNFQSKDSRYCNQNLHIITETGRITIAICGRRRQPYKYININNIACGVQHVACHNTAAASFGNAFLMKFKYPHFINNSADNINTLQIVSWHVK